MTPLQLDTRDFDAKTTIKDTAAQTKVTIYVDAKKAQKNLALAVWDLPRQ